MNQCAERNAYADHLVEVNKTNPVVTRDDVCNSLGATIVPKGTYITEDVANKIARFELLQPLELLVSLSSTLSPGQLYQDYQASYASLSKEGIPVHPQVSKELALRCGQYGVYPLLAQKLTVLSERLPNIYEDMLPASTFAVMLGVHLGLNSESLHIVFTATQLHETGFLNIPHEQAKRFDSFDEPERNEIFAQQLKLGKQFIDLVPNLSKKIGRAVAEHKERLDGSGWPQGKSDGSTSIESQVVALAVMLKEVYRKQLKPKGYGLAHLSSVMQTDEQGFQSEAYNAMLRMLRQISSAKHNVLPIEFIPSLAAYLSVLQRTLIHWFDLAQQCADQIRAVGQSEATDRPIKITTGLRELFRNSGLWDKEMNAWMREVESSAATDDLYEIETVALMYDAIQGKLKRLQWALNEADLRVGGKWKERCEGLAHLLYSLPSDHFDALQKYGCLDD